MCRGGSCGAGASVCIEVLDIFIDPSLYADARRGRFAKRARMASPSTTWLCQPSRQKHVLSLQGASPDLENLLYPVIGVPFGARADTSLSRVEMRVQAG